MLVSCFVQYHNHERSLNKIFIIYLIIIKSLLSNMILLLSSRIPDEQEMYQNLTISPGYADSDTFTTTPLIPAYNTTTHSVTSFAGNLQIGKL